jgi:hypothetical protein
LYRCFRRKILHKLYQGQKVLLQTKEAAHNGTPPKKLHLRQNQVKGKRKKGMEQV